MPKPIYKRAKTQQLIAFQQKTVGDILNYIRRQQQLNKIVTKS